MDAEKRRLGWKRVNKKIPCFFCEERDAKWKKKIKVTRERIYKESGDKFIRDSYKVEPVVWNLHLCDSCSSSQDSLDLFLRDR